MISLIENLVHLIELVLEGSEIYPLLLLGMINASLAALVLFALIIGLKRFAGKKIAAKYWYFLWMVVCVRLFLPVAPTSSLSLHQFWQSRTVQRVEETESGKTVITQIETQTAPLVGWIMETTALATDPQGSEIPYQTEASTEVSRHLVAAMAHSWFIAIGLLALAWPVGVGYCFVRLLWTSALFRGSVGRLSLSDDVRLLEILRESKADLGIRREIGLKVVPGLSSPAQMGIRRPTVLLPEDVIETFSNSELRQIMLHELVHIKRRDAWGNLLLMSLQVAYWWNPLFWMLRNRILAERELACDALVLQKVGKDQATSYGETLLKIVERLTAIGNGGGESALSIPVSVPAFWGRMERTAGLKRRLEALAYSDRGISLPMRWLSAGLVAFTAYAGWTDAAPIIRRLPILHVSVPKDAVWTTTSAEVAPIESRERFVYHAGGLLDHIRAKVQEDRRDDAEKIQEISRDSTRWLLVDRFLAPATGITGEGVVAWEGDDLIMNVTPSEWIKSQRVFQQFLQSDFNQITTEVRMILTNLDLVKEVGLRGGEVVSKPVDEIGRTDSEMEKSPWTNGPVYTVSLDEAKMKQVTELAQKDARSNLVFAPKVTTFSGIPAEIADTVQRPFVTGWKGQESDRQPRIEIVEEGTRVRLRAATISGSDEIEVSANLRLSGIEEVRKILYSVAENGQTSGLVQYPIFERIAF